MNTKRVAPLFFVIGVISCSIDLPATNHDEASMIALEEEGSAAVEAGDYRLAVEIARPLAEKGDPEAIFTVGFVMLEWLQDPFPKEKPAHSADDAMCWIWKAAKLGLTQAASTLRVGYEWGRYSLPRNETLSLCWKAVEIGDKAPTECFESETSTALCS